MKKKYLFTLLFSLCAMFSLQGKTMAKFDNDTKSCALVEEVLFVIKPDAVAADQIGEILDKVEATDLHIIGLKMVKLDNSEVEVLYQAHVKKPFYKDLSKYMTSGPIVLVVVEGKDAIATMRSLAGSTDPTKADKNSIRSQYGTDVQRNAVHVSDSVKAAKREISLFFTVDELFSPCSKEVFKDSKAE